MERGARSSDREADVKRGRGHNDLRGRAYAPLDPLKLQTMQQYDVIDAETLAAIVDDLAPDSSRRLRLFVYALSSCLIGSLILAIFFGGFFYFASGRSPMEFFQPRLLWLTNLLIPSFCVILVGYAVRLRVRRARQTPLVMLRYKRCPCCGYNLTGLQPDSDDRAIVCAECGHAWANVRNHTV